MAKASAIPECKPKVTAQKPCITRQLLSCILGWSSTFNAGITLGYVAVGLHSLQEEGSRGEAPFHLTDQQYSIFGSMLNAVAIISGIFSGWVTHRYGRKRPATFLIVPYSASWLLVAFPVNYPLFLTGASIGWFTIFLRLPFTRLHVSEIAHPSHRGQLMSSLLSGFMAGSCLEYIAALAFNWKGLAIMNSAIAAAFALAELKIPESHAWLISKGRSEDARRNLQWFYGEHYNIEEDFLEAENHYLDTKEAVSKFREIFRFQYLKPVIIIVLLLGVRNFCGQVILTMFMTKIFKESHMAIDPVHGAIILGAMQLVVTICSGKIIDVFGRRKAIMVSGLVHGLSNLAFATYMYFKETPSLAYMVESYPWMPVTFLTLAVVGFCMGSGPVLVVLLGEMLPIQIKNVVNGFLNAWMSATGLIAVAAYQPMVDAWGISGSFWFYGINCFVLVILFLMMVPETKGQTLGDIERKMTSTDLEKTLRLAELSGKET